MKKETIHFRKNPPIKRAFCFVMRIKILPSVFFITCFLCLSSVLDGQLPWNLRFTVSPAYFGPNALPVPELHIGTIETFPTIETGAEAYFSSGDQTRNLVTNIFIPVTRNRIGISVFYVPVEYFRVDSMTNLLRHSMDSDGIGWAAGDFHIGTFIQLIRDHSYLPDVMLTINLKTASGTNLLAVRYTDSPAYYFDLNAGRTIRFEDWSLRIYGMTGFYCYQTNLVNYPQNDAVMYGFGISPAVGKYDLSLQLTGYSGYLDNGDHPMLFRAIIGRSGMKNPGLKLMWQSGLRDFDYNSLRFSLIWKIRSDKANMVLQ